MEPSVIAYKPRLLRARARARARARWVAPLLGALCLAGCLEARPSATAGRETTAAECQDGVDNDLDGRRDCRDPDCQAFAFCYQVDAGRADAALRPDSRPCRCDDGLDCTTDTCRSNGSCLFVPRPGFCIIDGRCYKRDERKPDDACKRCDPVLGPRSWVNATFGPCDDKDPCTRDDTCRSGVCRGRRYSCDDKLDCTDDVCDGKGGCKQTLRADNCLIGGQCFAAGAARGPSCDVCDPKQDPRAWSSGSGCVFGQSCLPLGQTDASGCRRCNDPGGGAAPELTIAAGKCAVGATCYSDKQTVGLCLVCDAARSQTALSLASSGAMALRTGFEAAPPFTIQSSSSRVRWNPVNRGRSFAGEHAAYYGNPTAKNYDSGTRNSGVLSTAELTLPAGRKAEVRFFIYVDVEGATAFDRVTFEVVQTAQKPKVLWEKTSSTKLRTWLPVVIDLSAYAGKVVRLQWVVDTVDNRNNNRGEGVFLDEVVVAWGC